MKRNISLSHYITRSLVALFLIATVIYASVFILPELLPSPYSDHRYPSFEIGAGLLISAAILGLIYVASAMLRMRKELNARSFAHSEALTLALHDPLTGLPNRRRLLEAFDDLSNNLAPDRFRTVMMLDLDGFKPINDVYGHAFGDTLLTSFANRLMQTVGKDGIVARIGGDEFAIVSPVFGNKAEASGFARRVLTHIGRPFDLGGRQVSIGACIGIALYPDDGHAITELLRRADIALYRAKSSGRCTYRFFEVEMDASILHRTLLEQRLRQAIPKDGIDVHFQPIMDMETGRIAGFEALARWTDSDFGEVPPLQFISIAEDCGVIFDLTRNLLARACTAAKAWPDDVYLSFNLSPVQLQDPSLSNQIVSILEKHAFPSTRLVLEITETSLLKNPVSAHRILTELTEAGVSIALDDFGAGHSSLSYLRDLPIRKVKIDRSFTERMLTDKQCAAIVEAILVLSRGLDIDAIAEGVEESAIHQALSAGGCHFSQGFLYASAVSAEDASGFLSAQSGGRLLFSEQAGPA